MAKQRQKAIDDLDRGVKQKYMTYSTVHVQSNLFSHIARDLKIALRFNGSWRF